MMRALLTLAGAAACAWAAPGAPLEDAANVVVPGAAGAMRGLGHSSACRFAPGTQVIGNLENFPYDVAPFIAHDARTFSAQDGRDINPLSPNVMVLPVGVVADPALLCPNQRLPPSDTDAPYACLVEWPTTSPCLRWIAPSWNELGNMTNPGRLGTPGSKCSCNAPARRCSACGTYAYRNLELVRPSASATATASITPSRTANVTSSPPMTVSQTATESRTANSTRSSTGTSSATSTATRSPVSTSTGTSTPPVTVTPTLTGTATGTPSSTLSVNTTASNSATATANATSTSTDTPAATSNSTLTGSGTSTESGTPTATSTSTPTSTNTGTGSVTSNPTVTPTATATSNTPSWSSTPTQTQSRTASRTRTPTATQTPTGSQRTELMFSTTGAYATYKIPTKVGDLDRTPVRVFGACGSFDGCAALIKLF